MARARGDARSRSDLDIGLLAADGSPLSYSVMGMLAADLASLLAHDADVSHFLPELVAGVARRARTVAPGDASK
jgi:hypothetical protein